MKKFLIIFYFVFLVSFLKSQIVVPTNIFILPIKNVQLISNFCEFRKTHFHAGFDFRAPLNTPIYAIADGFVSRIKIEPGGYGKALYITHYNADSGFISVYAHINYFTSYIENWVKNCQYQKKTFTLDTALADTIFKIQKGQIIGYIGNRGYSFGPHLHFEIRNLIDEPFNPYLFGLKINDSKAPFFNKIALYSANDTSFVEDNDFVLYDMQNIPKTIRVFGSFYVGVDAQDYVDATSNKMATYQTMVFDNDLLVYHSRFDKISYQYTKDYYSMIDYKQKLQNKLFIQRCVIDPNNELFHYVYSKNNGIININDTFIHTIKIVVIDFAGNSAVSKIKVKKYIPNITKSSQKGIFFQANSPKTIEMKGLQITFPEKSLFKNEILNFDVVGQADISVIYSVGDKYIALKKPITLTFDISNIQPELQKKIVLCSYDAKDKVFCIIGAVQNNLFIANSSSMGKFFLNIDTLMPTLTPTNFKANQNVSNINSLKIKAKDNISGIKTYNAFVNDKWVLLEYDLKNDMLQYTFDSNTPKGKFKFTVVVTDGLSNMSIFETNLTR